MQDKEFDRLFNSKLDNFEIQPSPMVWDKIADELHEKKARRSIVPYISIAASIVILVSAGLLFFNQTEETYVKPVKRGEGVAKATKPETFVNTIKSTVITTPEITKASTNKLATVSKHPVFIAPKVIADEPVNRIIIESNDQVMPDPLTSNQPSLVIIAPVQKDPVMEVPDKETSFVAVIENKQQVTETTSTEIIETSVKKRGIHSLGGLIGALVAKVDKREDKLIEFTENEENGSTITGLNLGLIKIKRK
ncbi:hypothetical protein [Mucilaginibacter puniceus]